MIELLSNPLVDFVSRVVLPGLSVLVAIVAVVYRPRVLGQWCDGIRIYAAASSPTRSRRT